MNIKNYERRCVWVGGGDGQKGMWVICGGFVGDELAGKSGEGIVFMANKSQPCLHLVYLNKGIRLYLLTKCLNTSVIARSIGRSLLRSCLLFTTHLNQLVQ